MKHSRNGLFLVLSLALALFVAACGNSSTTSTTTSTGSGGSNNGYGGSSNPTPTPTTSSAAATTLNTTTLSVGGKSMTVLTDAKGMTLYYRTSDAATSVCSGGCASAWPPVLSSSVPTTSTKLSGTFTLMNNANGSQVAYNGHPLYTFASDSAPGQANGQGVGNVWYVASTDLAAGSKSTAGSTPTPSGYYKQP